MPYLEANIAKGKGVVLIAAAQMIGRLDSVSFLLTVGGIFMAIFAIIGWSFVKSEAREIAREVALEEARKIAQNYYATKGEERADIDNPSKNSYNNASTFDAGAGTESGATKQ